MKWISICSIVSVLGFVINQQAAGPDLISHLFLATATIAIGVLLFWGYQYVIPLAHNIPMISKNMMRAHIILHTVPASYLIVYLFSYTTILLNSLYLTPILLFFWTGRKTWEVLFEQTHSKIYFAFLKGNTAMMISLPTLLALELFYKEIVGVDIFSRLITLYFTVHLLLVGFSLIKITESLRQLSRDVDA